MLTERDSGDEDDADLCPHRGIRVAMAGWTFREGKCLVLYPAERIPSEPDHDPGDEEPRMRMHPRLFEYFNACL